MRRREYLRKTGALGATVLTGCLGAAGSNPSVMLPEPDRRFESSEVPYPAWGEKIPDVSVPAPLENREVEMREFSKPRLITFFYSYCQTVCPVLISTMRNVQTHSLNNGYGDSIEILTVTFDPERDKAERLGEYAERMNVDTEAGNWHFLRPESKSRAEEVVTDGFGVAFQRTHPENMDRYMFTHTSLTFLVNSDGYVERAYNTSSPKAESIIEDLEKVREA